MVSIFLSFFFFKIWNLTFSIGSSSNIVLMIISYIVEARIVENFVFVFFVAASLSLFLLNLFLNCLSGLSVLA